MVFLQRRLPLITQRPAASRPSRLVAANIRGKADGHWSARDQQRDSSSGGAGAEMMCMIRVRYMLLRLLVSALGRMGENDVYEDIETCLHGPVDGMIMISNILTDLVPSTDLMEPRS